VCEYFEVISKNVDNIQKIAESRTGQKCREYVKITSSETTGKIYHLRKKYKIW